MNELSQYGSQLLTNGYNIVPIQPGEKHPGMKGWSTVQPSFDNLNKWLANGHAHAGIGIITERAPAIDIDVSDESVVDTMVDWIDTHIGQGLRRIGRPPRALLAFRTDQPFSKMLSAKYADATDPTITHRIEILGKGQQYAALHIHPGTQRPYIWPEDSPATTPYFQLPLLRLVDCRAVLTAFEALGAQMVTAGKWVFLKRGAFGVAADLTPTDVDALLDRKAPAPIEPTQLDHLLSFINADDYDQWVHVGMALHHQFDGNLEGVDVWDRWSQTGKNYNGVDSLLAKWNSFSETRDSAVTVASIFHWAKTEQNVQAESYRLRLNKMIAEAQSYTDLMDGPLTKDLRKYVSANPVMAVPIQNAVKSRASALLGSTVPLADVKKALKSAPGASAGSSEVLAPGEHSNGALSALWEGWYYLAENDEFFSTAQSKAYSPASFNAIFNKRVKMPDDQRNASALATDIYGMQVLNGARYRPGQPLIFTDELGTWANIYKDTGAPLPQFYDTAGTEIVKAMLGHLEAVIEDPRDREMLLDYIAWTVQQPGKKIRWAILVWGHEGIGKTFLAEMCQAMLGTSNVKPVDPAMLGGNFQDWAAGSLLNFVEEIRLEGKDRYAILNKMKPYISNGSVHINPKGKTSYTAVNVTNYMMFTNFEDALPLDEDNTRYYVIFTRFKTKEEARQYRVKHEKFYGWLFESMRANAGSLRKYFTERVISEAFNNNARAPESQGKHRMVEVSRNDEERMLEDLLDQGGRALGMNETLLSVTWLRTVWPLSGALPWPGPTRMLRTLAKMGYVRVPLATYKSRVKLGRGLHTIYTKDVAWSNCTDLDLVRDAIGGNLDNIAEEH